MKQYNGFANMKSDAIERAYVKAGLDIETGLPVEKAAEKFASEAQGEIDYERLYNLLRAAENLDSAYRARDNATRDFTHRCMEENIIYFGNQVLQYAQ